MRGCRRLRVATRLPVPPGRADQEGRFVERARLDAARADLEAGDDTLDAVAERCGLGNAESLRRVFHRHLEVSPGARWRRVPHDHPPKGALA